MTIYVLLLLLVTTIVVFVRFATGVNLLWWMVQRVLQLFRHARPDREEMVSQFIEGIVEKMLADERIVNAIYARTQAHTTDIGYIFTSLGLFFSLTALPLVSSNVGLNNLVWLLFFLVALASFAALGRIEQREDQDRAIIALYEEKIGIPKRP